MAIVVQQNIPLSTYTTLGVGGEATYFVTVHNEDELVEAYVWAREKNVPIYILGGGSNTLVDDAGVAGLVVHLVNKGIQHEVRGTDILLSAQAGELLDDVVSYAVQKNWWGLENLSHIPGTVGATPVQNVGAYGVEVSDVIQHVRVFNSETQEFEVLENTACAFSYRNSLFKTLPGKKYIITEVTFKLSSVAKPNISYKDLQHVFEGVTPTVQDIRIAIIKIRAGKFPDWTVIGTAGSFFKNPIISHEEYVRLHAKYPLIPAYPTDHNQMKISLGWILDKELNLKGYTKNGVATYTMQALVLVVEKNATASAVENFANEIIKKIKNETGITVEWEVTKLK